jgi:hypothetical protein
MARCMFGVMVSRVRFQEQIEPCEYVTHHACVKVCMLVLIV